MAQQDEGMFTDEELIVINKTKEIRLKLIEDMTEDEMPTRAGDIRVLNETMDAADRQVMELAKIRSKAKEVEGNSKTLGLVIEVLSRVGSDGPTMVSNKDVNLPDNFIPADIVPGETNIGGEELELSNFIRGNEDDE